jgi:hypothetical protein
LVNWKNVFSAAAVASIVIAVCACGASSEEHRVQPVEPAPRIHPQGIGLSCGDSGYEYTGYGPCTWKWSCNDCGCTLVATYSPGNCGGRETFA